MGSKVDMILSASDGGGGESGSSLHSDSSEVVFTSDTFDGDFSDVFSAAMTGSPFSSVGRKLKANLVLKRISYECRKLTKVRFKIGYVTVCRSCSCIHRLPTGVHPMRGCRHPASRTPWSHRPQPLHLLPALHRPRCLRH